MIQSTSTDREATMNAYEIAAERFEQVSRQYNAKRAALEAALVALDDEYDAAQNELAKYESKPGIPLPEFRPNAA
jgi:hypothetical protein